MKVRLPLFSYKVINNAHKNKASSVLYVGKLSLYVNFLASPSLSPASHLFPQANLLL